MSNSVWISSIAAMLLWTPWAAGQDDRYRSEHQIGPIRVVVQAVAEPGKAIKVPATPLKAADKTANVVVVGTVKGTVKLGDYWVGVSCRPAGDALRAQLRLSEDQGLVVDYVVAEGPAAKAGVQQHDVLFKAGKTPLKELADLVAAVEAAKESEVALELIRGGKKKTIKLTPAKRPEDAAARLPLNVLPEGIHRDRILRWIPEIELGKMPGPIEFRIIRPGALLPPTVKVHPPMPGNLSIAITKQGDNPKKIVVTRGDQKWEVTEKNLEELPDDVRPHVERMLGRINFTAPLEKIRTFNFVPKVMRPDSIKPKLEQRLHSHVVAPVVIDHRQHQKQIDKQLGEMARQIEELRKSLDQLHKSVPAGEQPEEK